MAIAERKLLQGPPVPDAVLHGISVPEQLLPPVGVPESTSIAPPTHTLSEITHPLVQGTFPSEFFDGLKVSPEASLDPEEKRRAGMTGTTLAWFAGDVFDARGKDDQGFRDAVFASFEQHVGQRFNASEKPDLRASVERVITIFQEQGESQQPREKWDIKAWPEDLQKRFQ